MEELYSEFLNVANKLNCELEISPLLYGSLGLQKITDFEFCPDDIDILIPQIYLDEKWNIFRKTIEELGYELIDLHEHAFLKDKYKIAFAEIESLVPFAGLDIEYIENRCDKGIKYRILNLKEYLKVYLQSSKDGYRKMKNNDKDLIKIEILKHLLNK